MESCLQERELTLQDGRVVLVRPVVPSDDAELRRAVRHADPETLRLRFLGGRPPRTDAEFTRLVTLDFDRRAALAAFDAQGVGVGIARYEALEHTDTAEVAVAVDPDWRHVGLATELLHLLASLAIANGIRTLTAEFFADNVDVSELLAETGAPYRNAGPEEGVITAEVTLPVDDTPAR